MAGVGQQLGKAAARQQAHVLREHGEEAAHQEMGHGLGIVLLFQRPRQPRQAIGDVTRHPCAASAGIQAHGIEPELAQEGAHFRVDQLGQADAIAGGIGEGGVVAAAAGKLGVERQAVAHICNDQERRPTAVSHLGRG